MTVRCRWMRGEPDGVGGAASGLPNVDRHARQADPWPSISRAMRAAGSKRFLASAWLERRPSPPSSPIRKPSDRDATLQHGSDWCRARTSTGGKQRLGRISKQGDRYLRRILVVGAHAVLRRARLHPEKYPWLTALLARRPCQGRGGGARQQDGSHRVGAAGQGRNLSSAAARGCRLVGFAMGSMG